jgi:hypothetical protein
MLLAASQLTRRPPTTAAASISVSHLVLGWGIDMD